MKRERRLASLVGRLIGAQEEQRRRLAYEVHDGLAQVAASAYRYLQDFSYLYPQNSDRAQEELERITDLVKRTVEEARRTIASLRPAVLDDLGLESTISFELERLRREGFNVSYEETLGRERLPDSVETALFRVFMYLTQKTQRYLAAREGIRRVTWLDQRQRCDISEN